MKPTPPKAAATDALDHALAEKLRLLGVNVKPKNAYLETFGWAKGRPGFDEAANLGAEWRAEVNRASLQDSADANGHP